MDVQGDIGEPLPKAPGGPTPVTWLEPIALSYKKKRAWLALAIGFAFASLFGWVAWRSNDAADGKAIAWLVVSLALGFWRYWAWMRKETVRRYASTEQVLTWQQRFKAAAPWLALGVPGTAILFAMQWNFNEVSYSSLIFTPFALVGLFIFFFRRKAQVLTLEAAQVKEKLEPTKPQPGVPAEPAPWEKKLDELFARRIVRYPISAALLWGSYWVATESDYKKAWVLATLLAVFGLLAAFDAFLWLLLAGIIIGVVVLGFNAVAALPVSVAVIIGALIIAGSMKK